MSSTENKRAKNLLTTHKFTWTGLVKCSILVCETFIVAYGILFHLNKNSRQHTSSIHSESQG